MRRSGAQLIAAVAYAIASSLPWAAHPQWVVLTIAAVMQGSLAQTIARRNARVLGTFYGCILVAALAALSSPALFSTYFLLASGVAHAFFGVRYSVTAGAAAVMAVLQSYLAAPSEDFGTIERLCDTLIGALIGWAAMYALPIWESRKLSTLLKHAMVAFAAYAQEVFQPRGASMRDSARVARQWAYDALDDIIELQTRSKMDPSGTRSYEEDLSRWLLGAHATLSHLSAVRLSLATRAPGEEKCLLPHLSVLMREMQRMQYSPSGDSDAGVSLQSAAI